MLVEGEDRLTQGVVRLQALADGWLTVIRPVLHLASAQRSADHRLHGAVKHHNDVGGPAHLRNRERGWVRKKMGSMAPCSPRDQESRIVGPTKNN